MEEFKTPEERQRYALKLVTKAIRLMNRASKITGERFPFCYDIIYDHRLDRYVASCNIFQLSRINALIPDAEIKSEDINEEFFANRIELSGETYNDTEERQ